MSGKGFAQLLVQDLLRVRSEIGRLPSRDQYIQLGKYPKSAIVESFGSWTLFIQASGLQYSAKGKRDKQEIRKEAFEYLKKEVQSRSLLASPPSQYRHIFVWSDRHKPYHHIDSVPFLIAIKGKYESLGKPFDLVIDPGDGEDFHALSFHDSDPDLLAAGHELEAVIEANQPLYKAFPEVMICESNHGSLVFRKGKHHGIPRHVLKSYAEVIKAPPGWSWHHEIIVQMSNGQKCLFHHGYSSNTLLASQKRGMSIVQGHFHSKFGIQYWANATGTYFAAQVGCLINDASLAFAYNKLTLERPLLGCLRIEEGVPHLLPMLLDKHGRWTGFVP